MIRRFKRWLCAVSDHDWRREVLADGCVRWWCARCDEPPRYVGDRRLVDDYHGAMPDRPPGKDGKA